MPIEYEEIPYSSPIDAFAAFADTPGSMLYDSADSLIRSYGTNRYSYILVDPFKSYSFSASPNKELDPLLDLRQLMAKYKINPNPKLPPFQGGAAGFISYDLVHHYEPVNYADIDGPQFPQIMLGFYDLVCAFDNQTKKAFVISSGHPQTKPQKMQKRALSRISWFKSQIKDVKKERASNLPVTNISANFTNEEYKDAVQQVIDYIKAGDIFEANLTQRFSASVAPDFDYFMLYRNLCEINPSPFAAFVNFNEIKIISASPERFLKLENGKVEARPIKGTRKRCENFAEDKANIDELINSEKDIAENIMIVDLMRNDLSKVCEDDSIKVPQLCGHEIYPTVHHLVSVITGQIRTQFDAFDLLKAAFPAGSITGAPKIRAMQIISELEPDNRGAYCGHLALIGFDGNMDTSILIRTFVVNGNKLSFNAGGAVVIDSNPVAEYEESLVKSFALKKALAGD